VSEYFRIEAKRETGICGSGVKSQPRMLSLWYEAPANCPADLTDPTLKRVWVNSTHCRGMRADRVLS